MKNIEYQIENGNTLFKALSIAKRFQVVRHLLLLHQIAAPYKQKYTSCELVREPVSWVYAHSSTDYCEYKVRESEVRGLRTPMQGLPSIDEEI